MFAASTEAATRMFGPSGTRACIRSRACVHQPSIKASTLSPRLRPPRPLRRWLQRQRVPPVALLSLEIPPHHHAAAEAASREWAPGLSLCVAFLRCLHVWAWRTRDRLRCSSQLLPTARQRNLSSGVHCCSCAGPRCFVSNRKIERSALLAREVMAK